MGIMKEVSEAIKMFMNIKQLKRERRVKDVSKVLFQKMRGCEANVHTRCAFSREAIIQNGYLGKEEEEYLDEALTLLENDQQIFYDPRVGVYTLVDLMKSWREEKRGV